MQARMRRKTANHEVLTVNTNSQESALRLATTAHITVRAWLHGCARNGNKLRPGYVQAIYRPTPTVPKRDSRLQTSDAPPENTKKRNHLFSSEAPGHRSVPSSISTAAMARRTGRAASIRPTGGVRICCDRVYVESRVNSIWIEECHIVSQLIMLVPEITQLFTHLYGSTAQAC